MFVAPATQFESLHGEDISATAPATGWMILVMGSAGFDASHATQMPDTATFWNRCGEATAEEG